ncbi:hypothetical protein L218DRAFT_962046, partial [Marasmius fiardii PR-910]
MRKLVGLAAAVATTEPRDLSELITRVNKLDISINNPALNIGRGGTRAQSGSGGGRDPNAMDVDATSTSTQRTGMREEFVRWMRNRCFGCGGLHLKRDCNWARGVTCNYCKRAGHLEQVCQNKFMGKERGGGLAGRGRQWIAATNTEEHFSLFDEEGESHRSLRRMPVSAATRASWKLNVVCPSSNY